MTTDRRLKVDLVAQSNFFQAISQSKMKKIDFTISEEIKGSQIEGGLLRSEYLTELQFLGKSLKLK